MKITSVKHARLLRGVFILTVLSFVGCIVLGFQLRASYFETQKLASLHETSNTQLEKYQTAYLTTTQAVKAQGTKIVSLSDQLTSAQAEVKKIASEKTSLEKKVATLQSQLAVEEPVATPEVKPASLSAGASPQGRTVQVEATAYTARCKGCSGITRTGLDVRNSTPAIIAVDPSVIPLKSRVRLWSDGEVIGVFTAEDTGGAIKGHRIDILAATYDEAMAWGRRDVTVEFLD